MPADSVTAAALAACIRGEADALREALVDPDRLLATAEAHQVVALATTRLSPQARQTPAGRRMVERSTQLATLDVVRERDVRSLLQALAEAGVPVLLFKGAQLAYTHYPRPDLRPRVDTDLLTKAAARPLADTVLQRLGYRPILHVDGDLVNYQASYVLSRADVAIHTVDLHWRVANPQRFADVLTFTELHARSVPLPALSAHARGLSDPDALLLACVHRVIHHADAPTLIWQYDVHLLASRLEGAGWTRFVELAGSRRVARVCEHSLRASASAFHTDVPAVVWQTLAEAGTGESDLSAVLDVRRRQGSRVMDDLRVLPAWRDRLRLIHQHLLPSKRYMREVYAPTSIAPLPVLYARRAWRGARKWIGRS